MPAKPKKTTEEHDPVEAERLKILGNELYQRGEYDAAHFKYTQAIEKDPTNAIIYANRAAVSLATKDYFDAAFDCRKAVELDPTYAKAWGRLGTATHAVSAWEDSIRAWKEALECLPTGNLTEAQQSMKDQFSRGLARAKADRRKVETGVEAIPSGPSTANKFPWDVAFAVKRRKLASDKPSCVMVIIYAHGEFDEAMRTLTQQRLITHPQTGEPAVAGNPNVLQPLVNSILTDERVFHITEPDFQEKSERQCLFESQMLLGWVSGSPPLADIKRQILQRLKRDPWQKVRPSISTTVRTWIFRAFLHWQLLGKHVFAHELFTQALKFLEWGRKQWPNVPASERGVVFEISWIRGVKRQHLALMHASKAHNGQDSPFSFEDLIAAAKDLVEDVDSNPPGSGLDDEDHIGHSYAYWIYPKAQALSILGWSYMQAALRAHDGDPLTQSVFETASEYYLAAAEGYPTDDSYHPTFLRKHLECLCQMDKPLKVTLPLGDRILEVLPESLEIWGLGPTGDALRQMQESVRKFATHWRAEVREGRATMDDVGKIDMPLVPKLKTEKDGLPFSVKYLSLGNEGEERGRLSGAK